MTVCGCMIYYMKWARTWFIKSSLKSLKSVVNCGYTFEDINNVLTKIMVRVYFENFSMYPFILFN